MKRLCFLFVGLSILAGSAVAQAAPDPSDAAFRDAQLMTAAQVGDALADGAVRIAAGDPALRALVDADRAAEQTRRALELQVAALRGQAGPAVEARQAGVRRDLQAATETAARSRTALLQAFPNFAVLTDPAPLAIKEVQALLQPGEALVLMQPVGDHIHLWAVTREGSVWRRTDAATAPQDVQALTDRLRQGTGRGAEDASKGAPQPGQDGQSEARRLYEILWRPIEPAVGASRTVYVAAGDYLAELPPALLIGDRSQGAEIDYLVRRHAFVSLPSVSSLRTARSLARMQTVRTRFVGFGMARQDQAPTKGFADLPGVQRELHGMARTLGVRSGSASPQATEADIKASDLDGVAIIDFAAHGLPAGSVETGGEPALMFGAGGGEDGYLTASEAAHLRLSADLVILSACDSGAAGAPGPAYGGLMRAFFFAGARSLLIANWDLDDRAAARLTTEVARQLRRGATTAEALRQAQLKLLNSPEARDQTDPAKWAALSLVGDGGAILGPVAAR